MRLIDADNLIKDVMELWDYKTVDGITATTVLKQTITDIENQPTVKAIPIEFIEERIKKAVAFTHSKAEGNIIADGCVVTVVSASFTAQVLANLLEAWEGQNEKDI